jgi:hypothetical protein
MAPAGYSRRSFVTLAKGEAPSKEGAPGGLNRASGFPLPLSNSVRRVFPSTASNGPSMATFDDGPRLKCRPHPPKDLVLYATAVLAPRSTRSPKGFPRPRTSRFNVARLPATPTRPSRGPWLASGLCCPPGSSLTMASSESLNPSPPLLNLRRSLLHPRNRLRVGIQRFPNLLRRTVLACRLPYPGGPEECR